MEQRTTYHRYEHEEPVLVGPESRPSLGFPLGTALLLIVIFSLSGVFSCCYHWDKLRTLRQRNSNIQDSDAASDAKPAPTEPKGNQVMQPESVAVIIMPGDQTAKFIAMPCPPHPQLTIHNYVYQPKPPTPTPFPIPLYI